MKPTANLKLLVADDEPLARARVLEALRGKYDSLSLVECSDGARVAQQLNRDGFDIAILDIEMPGLTGIELARTIRGSDSPLVILVTAHVEYAVEAFDCEAFDYVVKPYCDERLLRAVSRAETEVLRRRTVDNLNAPRRSMLSDKCGLSDANDALGGGRGFTFRASGVTIVIREIEIDRIESADYCSIIHIGDVSHCVRESLTSLEQRVTPGVFCRIHRSSIVRLDRVQAVERDSSGSGTVVLRDGTRHRVSQARRGQLLRMLQHISR